MLTLIIAAFLLINALSLLLMSLVAVGMAARAPKRRRLWRLMVLPVLAVLLTFQYAVRTGLPPPLRDHGSAAAGPSLFLPTDGEPISYDQQQLWCWSQLCTAPPAGSPVLCSWPVQLLLCAKLIQASFL